MRLVELQEDEPLGGCVVYVVGKGEWEAGIKCSGNVMLWVEWRDFISEHL